MMLLTRVWSALADPIGGSLIDRCRPGKTGRFRRWLIMFSAPLAASAAMMFTDPGLGPRGGLVWVYAANFLYCTFFTGVNIPFGSLASVISPLESDRSSLSTFRSLGSSVGSMPVMILMPLLAYSTNEATGVKYPDGRRMLVGVVVLGALSVATLSASFALTKERVAPPVGQGPPRTGKTVLALAKNRPFLALCLASVLHMGVVNYTQSLTSYLFKDYFRQPGLFSLYAVFNYAPMAALMLLVGRLVRRFGKKELCAAGILVSVAAYAAAFALRVADPWIYLVFCLFMGMGLACFTLQLWAIVTDVLDYQALLSGQRDEGTAFGFFFFARKIGFAAADSGSVLALKRIGYDGTLDIQPEGVARRLYRAVTALPAVALLAMFLLLAFAYPLGKGKLREMRERIRATE
jgi:GPH family glycoside/pentoside/hexuronide:cation symporter